MSNFSALVRKSLKLYMNRWSFALIAFLIVVFCLALLNGGIATTELLFFIYLIVPMFLIVFPSIQLPSEKSSKFADITLTNPVSDMEFFISRYLISVIVGLIYVAITMPFSAIFLVSVGSSLVPLFLKYLVSCILIILFVSGLGTALGTFFKKPILPITIGMIFAFLSSFICGFRGTFAQTDKTAVKTVLRFSPISLIEDFFNQITFPGSPVLEIDGTTSLIALVGMIVLFPMVGLLLFTLFKEGRRQAIGAILLAIAIVGPVLVTAINTEYEIEEEEEDEDYGRSYGVVVISQEDSTSLSDDEKLEILCREDEYDFEGGLKLGWDETAEFRFWLTYLGMKHRICHSPHATKSC